VNAFHVVGALFAAWAVVVAVLGISREGFPRGRGEGLAVGTISVLLALGAIGTAIYTGATEEEDEGAEAKEPAAEKAPGGGSKLELKADASTLKFDKTSLEAKAGKVTVVMHNPAAVGHDVSIEGKGVEEKGKVVGKGGTSTVSADLKPGEYTFYCSVPGHRQGGMEGKLTVE
jgi:plastocyanin